MRVIGYTYDADYHCRDCTYKYLAEGIVSEMNDLINGFLDTGDEFDFKPTDSEGNEIHPMFDTDEWWSNYEDEGALRATLSCSDCGAEMDVWEAS